MVQVTIDAEAGFFVHFTAEAVNDVARLWVEASPWEKEAIAVADNSVGRELATDAHLRGAQSPGMPELRIWQQWPLQY